MRKLESKVFFLSENNKDLEKNIDLFRKKVSKDKDVSLRTINNIKRLTMKLRKA